MNIQDDEIYKSFVSGRNYKENSIRKVRKSLERYLEFYQHRGVDVDLAGVVENIARELSMEIQERGGMEREWTEFGAYLLETKNLAPKTAMMNAALVRSFLVFHYCPFSGRMKLPQAARSAQEMVRNRKYEYRPEDVKKLLEVVQVNRDRAIIMTIFQSGMDVSTALSLNYGDVKDELDKGISPILIHLKREKTQTRYRTLIGQDTIDALKLYLQERGGLRYQCGKCGHSWKQKRTQCPFPECDGGVKPYREKITFDSPLFATHQSDKSVSTNNIMKRIRDYVKLAGIVSEDRMSRADKNPGGTHALRAAFASILKYHKVDGEIVDGLMGHKVPYNSAYTRHRDNELREIYKDVEQYLSVTDAQSESETVAELRMDIQMFRDELADVKRELKEMKAEKE